MYCYDSPEYVKDMGTPDRLKAVTADMLNGVVSGRSLKQRQRAVFLDRDGTINVADIVLITAHIMGTINLNTESGINVSITDWNKDSKDNGGTAE